MGGNLTSVAGGAVSNIESVTAGLGAGTDTLTYSATSFAVNVNLIAGAASGFGAIANIENVTGTDNADTLSGDGLANTMNGGATADTLGGGASNDSLNGGADADLLLDDSGNDTLDGGAGADSACANSVKSF